MEKAPLDEMIAYVLREINLKEGVKNGVLVVNMCKKWPNVAALSISFALTSSATSLGAKTKGKEKHEALKLAIYKLASLVAADVYAIEGTGHVPAKASDILHFWRRTDQSITDTNRK